MGSYSYRTRAASGGDEADPDRSDMIVPVGVDEHHRLPSSESHHTADDRNHDARRHQRREYVIGAVPWGAMAVTPSVIPRKQLIEVLDQVTVGSGARLENCDPRRGVRNEHRHQPVAPTPQESRHPAGDIGCAGGAARPDPEDLGVHELRCCRRGRWPKPSCP